MGPSMTIGAVKPLWRKAATNVIVFHSPSGIRPITRSPRAARPESRAILVLTAVSSINTSRAGSSMPCSRIQRRRARATSVRSRSAACRLFFEGDAVPPKKPRKSTLAGSDPPLQKFRKRLLQGQIRSEEHTSELQSPVHLLHSFPNDALPIYTSRAGSSMPCSRIQRRRARATSVRSRSAACRLFFEGDAVPPKKPRKSTLAGSDPPLQKFRKRLLQGQI